MHRLQGRSTPQTHGTGIDATYFLRAYWVLLGVTRAGHENQRHACVSDWMVSPEGDGKVIRTYTRKEWEPFCSTEKVKNRGKDSLDFERSDEYHLTYAQAAFRFQCSSAVDLALLASQLGTVTLLCCENHDKCMSSQFFFCSFMFDSHTCSVSARLQISLCATEFEGHVSAAMA